MPTDDELAESLACFDFGSPPLSDDEMVITCRRVWEEGEPIRLVVHDHDGDFQFICGGHEHTTPDAALHLHAGHIFDRGPEQLRDFMYLRRGIEARHREGETWDLSRIPPDEDD